MSDAMALEAAASETIASETIASETIASDKWRKLKTVDDDEQEQTMISPMIRAAVAFAQQGGEAPSASDVVAALLLAEKESKRQKCRYAYEDLLGTWQLVFVSGTRKKKTPSGRTIKTVGSGRFLPGFVAIAITYAQSSEQAGSVENKVILGPLSLSLTGPTRFWPQNSLAFDFTALKAKLGAIALYDGPMRGGNEQNERFQTQSLKDQAFFTFFIVEPDCIAARGKGGGLALWIRRE